MGSGVHIFTEDEARATLPYVGPIACEIVKAYAELCERKCDPSDGLALEIERLVREVESTGAGVLNIIHGTINFPSVIEGYYSSYSWEPGRGDDLWWFPDDSWRVEADCASA